jgi:hypothetical protein
MSRGVKPCKLHDDVDGDNDDDNDNEIQSFRKKFYKVDLVDTKTNLRRMDAFSCTRMCDNAICIGLHYTPSIYFFFPFATPSFYLERHYFVSDVWLTVQRNSVWIRKTK